MTTNKPITGKLINNTFTDTKALYEYSYTIIKDATLLEFDRVYNETHKLEHFYNEQIKESVSNLFSGKNSCCFFFGPIDGGKSYTLRGGSEPNHNEYGLLGYAIQDIFNLVEMSKQTNLNNKTKTSSTYFAVKMSVYQVYLDQINDLLCNQYSKNLKLEKYYENDSKVLNTQIVDLTCKEVRHKKDYDSFLREAVQYRKCLSQSLKVNDMKRKSHLVISLILERRERTNEAYNKINERTIDKFSQIDFVELASSNYGLANLSLIKKIDPNIMNYNLDDLLYKTTSKTFDAICNNIVSATIGTPPKYDTKLTLALKNSLRMDSQIIFTVCVLPSEEPPKNSYKALKFSNWLRNQIYNLKENRDYKIQSTYEDSEEEKDIRFNQKENDVDVHMNRYQNKYADEENYQGNISASQNRKEYLEDDNIYSEHYRTSGDFRGETKETRLKDLQYSSNEEQEIRKIRQKMKKKYPYINTDGDDQQNNFDHTNNNGEKEIKSLRTLHTHHNRNDSAGSSNSVSHIKEKKLKDVEKSLRDLEAKSLEMSRCLENIRNSRINDESTLGAKHSHSNTQLNIDYEYERLKQESATLKSDNIIFREDINRLSDINRHLEEELQRQRNRNLDLAAENERLAQEKIQIKTEVDKHNENLSRLKIQDHNIMEQMNQRFMLENRIRDLENENRGLRDEKQKFEVEFRVLSERHNELKKNFDANEGELNYIKVKQAEEVNNIESKLDKMAKEMDFLQRENNNLRLNEERLRQEILTIEKSRDTYRDKYQDYKSKNNLLNAKLAEVFTLLFIINVD